MTPVLKASLLLLLILFLMAEPALGYPRLCRRRGAPGNKRPFNPERCKYGWELDACGDKTCTKGPGDLCGGKHNRYGICGEGLMCSNCNRCYGCSLKTFECFEDTRCNYFL